ncbi:hypothetical protein P153DRAFT_370777 [Dothidotthia symphoricarpi CBS 119687]|uniref:Uncharacterized protein n=1 Tax=Dothidotthia symphoricarpi CBS 119687 TaxID=1392245 RepID=A0A6A5ZZ85_9PLEO|nr:uncharacterized protein P153DRAFT_370777 [Dothidotthia symphoricarpi CBS 119687]KAF2124880.1 hypothetical protein P153DRAFT_370777 [Dothidotthia symphoricarpi CBS 119687]
MPDVDTSNAWVYEGFLALTVHGLLWISLRSWIYISTLRKLGESPKAIAYDKFALFMANFSETGITTLVLILVIGVPLMVPTVWEVVSKPNRQGFVWLAKKVKISYYAGGVCFRLLLAVISVVVTAMIWTHAIREVMSVGNGQTQLWNEAWKVPNPSADTIYGVILSLWS